MHVFCYAYLIAMLEKLYAVLHAYVCLTNFNQCYWRIPCAVCSNKLTFLVKKLKTRVYNTRKKRVWAGWTQVVELFCFCTSLLCFNSRGVEHVRILVIPNNALNRKTRANSCFIIDCFTAPLDKITLNCWPLKLRLPKIGLACLCRGFDNTSYYSATFHGKRL